MSRKKLDTRVFATPTEVSEIERGFNYTPQSEEDTNLFSILRMLAVSQQELDEQLSFMPAATLDNGNRFAIRTKQYVTYAEDIKTWYVFNGKYCQKAPKWFLFKCVDLVSQGLKREAAIQRTTGSKQFQKLSKKFAGDTPLEGKPEEKAHELQTRALAYIAEHPEETLNPSDVLAQIDESIRMTKHAHDLLSESERVRIGKNPITLLEQAAGCYGVAHHSEDYDKDGLLKVVLNGTLDLRYLNTPEKLLRVSKPEDLNTMCMNAQYIPDAQAPLTQSQLEWVFLQPGVPDTEKDGMLRYARMILGGCLDSTRVKGTFLILSGIAGSGKSILLSIVAGVFGSYVAHVDGSFFLDNPNRGKGDASPHLVKVINKALVIATEVKNASASQLDEQFIKNWTGGTDFITARGLYQEERSFLPRGQLIMSTNELPRLSGDKAVGDRYRLAVHHCSKAVPPSMRRDEDEFSRELEAEYSGVLNILLQGLRERNEIHGRIPQPDYIHTVTREYVASQDDIEAFFQACNIEVNPQSSSNGVGSNDLYKAYVKYKGENSTDLLSLKMFAMKLQGRGFRKIRTEKGFFWKGIQLGTKDSASTQTQSVSVSQETPVVSNGCASGHIPKNLLEELAAMDAAFAEL